MPSIKPSIQVTLATEAMRAERNQRLNAIEFLRRLDSGEEDGYDFSVSERLHGERR